MGHGVGDVKRNGDSSESNKYSRTHQAFSSPVTDTGSTLSMSWVEDEAARPSTSN